MTKFDADLSNPRAPIDREAMHELLDALLDLREQSDPDRGIDPADLTIPYVSTLHGSREEFESLRNTGPIKTGKDWAAGWALHCTGLLFGAVGGWAVSHCVGRWKRSAPEDSSPDSHEWETFGTETAASPPDTDDGNAVRRTAEIYIDEVAREVLPSWLSRELEEAFQALRFGVTPPVFDIDGTGQKNKGYKSHLRDHLLLQAIQYIKYREAQGFKKGDAIEEVATAFDRSPDAVRNWERKDLPKRFGEAVFSEVVELGIAAGKLKRSIQLGHIASSGPLPGEYAHLMWRLDALDLNELGEDFRRIIAEVTNGGSGDD